MTPRTPHDPSHHAAPARRQVAAWWAAVPQRTVHVVVALGLAAGLMATAGAHHAWTVLPLAAVLIAVSWRPLAPRGPATRQDAMGSLVAVAGTAAWAVVNMVLGAEYLLVVRDPGFLTLSGLWLVDHASTDLPALGSPAAAAAGTDVLPDASEAWNLRGDVIQPQGAKMLPATIAIGGWIAGDSGVLAANVAIGAVGILAVYALARLALGPYAALAPAGALALTVAHIGLSRPAYTEPLTLLLVIAGLVWAWRGVRERSLALLAAGGVASGATMLVRIDGTAFALGAAVGVIACLLLSDVPRRWRAAAATAFALPQLAMAALGLASLWWWSAEYIERLEDRSTLLNLAYAAGAVLALVVVWAAAAPVVDRALSRLRRFLAGTPAAWVAGAVALGLAVLASRPLWTTAHRGTESSRDEFANGVVESFQAAQGLEIDPTRTYAESTVTWLSYHLTWPLITLAIAGFAIGAHRMLRRDASWAVLLGGVLVPSLLYLVRPSIIPDQIWAIRRLEPMAIPGFVVAAAIGAWAAAAALRSARARRTARAWAAAGMLVLPLSTWLAPTPDADIPVSSAVNVTTREMVGARAMIDDLCALDPGRPIVLVGTHELYGGLRVQCDVPVVLALADQTATDLQAIAQAWGTAPLVLTRRDDAVPWTEAPESVVDASVRHSAYTLEGLPRTVYHRSYAWLAGTVAEDGTVTPLTPDTAPAS